MTRRITAALSLACIAFLAACATTTGGEQLAANSGEQGLICREVLRQSVSNQHQRVCLTAEGWEAYERTEQRNAQAQVARYQGFNYGVGN